MVTTRAQQYSPAQTPLELDQQRPHVPDEVEWSCLSTQLLINIFELQHHALDNCEAACVCSSWRTAVNSSHISSLHLHANCSSFNLQWCSFFSSRLSFGHLKLTSDLAFLEDSQQVYDQVWEDIQANGCCLEGIPIKTEVIDTDGDFGHVLHLYTDQHPDLKHLVVQSFCSPSQIGLPKLKQLTQLTKLEICKDQDEIVMSNLCRGLRNIPSSLCHMAIHHTTCCGRRGFRTHRMKQLMPHFKLLTHLEISDCCLTFIKSSITCLHGLSSLNLSDDSLWADWSNLSALTNLTALDLSHTYYYDMDSARDWETTDPLLTFTAWSRLRVLNVISCSLYDDQTILSIPLVQEVLVSWLPMSTTSTKICCHIESWDLAEFLELSVNVYAADCIVKLNLNLILDAHSCSACQLNSGLCELLHSCQSLQVLSVSLEGAVNIVVDAEHGSSLTDLRLERMSFSVLDLRHTSNLTSIQLLNLTPCRQGMQKPGLSLPGALLSFRVIGGEMFYPGDMPQLNLCNCLTSIVTGNGSLSLPVPQKPSLPTSLKHLEICASGGHDANWTEQFDWHCLDGCGHLESMVVPNKAFVSELPGAVQLHAWLKGARHMHVFAYAGQ